MLRMRNGLEVPSRSYLGVEINRYSRGPYFSLPLALSPIAWQSFGMLAEGVWAEVRVGGEHLRLFSEHNALGVQASVYNVKTQKWIAPSESVDDIQQGKERAETYAKAFLKDVGVELPSLEWKQSRAA